MIVLEGSLETAHFTDEETSSVAFEASVFFSSTGLLLSIVKDIILSPWIHSNTHSPVLKPSCSRAWVPKGGSS